MNREQRNNSVRLYLWAVFLVLGALGIAELTSTSKWPGSGEGPDPVLVFISERGAVLLAACLMVATAIAAIAPIASEIRLSAVLLVGILFAAYRLSRAFFDVPEPCQCLSHVSRLLGLGKTAASVLSLVVVGFLVMPSALLLTWNDETKASPHQAGSR